MSLIRRKEDRKKVVKEEVQKGPGHLISLVGVEQDSEMWNRGRMLNENVLEKDCGGGYHVQQGDGEIYVILSGEAEYNDNGTITTEVNKKEKPHTLTLGGSAGNYTFYDNVDKKYLALTSDNNKLFLQEKADDMMAKWNISISGGYASIANNKFAKRVIQYNASAPRFACYTGSQQKVALYKASTATGINNAPQWNTTSTDKVNVYTVTGVMVKRQDERQQTFQILLIHFFPFKVIYPLFFNTSR